MTGVEPLLLSDTALMNLIGQYSIPFARISSLLMVMPMIGARMVSPRIRLLLAVMIAVVSAPMLPAFAVPPLLSPAWLLVLASEICIGVAAGFLLQLFQQIFVLAGQFMAMKMGLGFASMNDPANGVQTTVLSQYFMMLTTLLFAVSGGHLIVIQALIESFTTLVPGVGLDRDAWYTLVSLGSWLFAAALVLSLPVMISLMVVNAVFGVMSRSAPQLNIFALGFPLTLIAGMIIVYISLTAIVAQFNMLFAETLQLLNDLLR